MAHYKSGQPTSAHDSIDMTICFRSVYEVVEKHHNGLIIDVFAGGGRDILSFYTLLNGEGRFVSIDADPQRIEDTIAKSGAAPFVEIQNADDLSNAFLQKKIAVLLGEFPACPFGETDIDFKGQADFVLCNAGIMFVSPENLKATLAILAAMLAKNGEMILRFSLDRADQHDNPNYYTHHVPMVIDLLTQEGLSVRRNPDVPDPQSRPFSWVDLHCRKSAKEHSI